MSLVVETPPVPLRSDAHGVMRVGATRVRLDTVLTEWNQGASPEQIVEDFDVLDLADVYAIISYYIRYRIEIDQYLEQTRLAGGRLYQENERRVPQAGIRDRLLARRAALSNQER